MYQLTRAVRGMNERSLERSLESCKCTVLLFQEIFYFEVSGFTNSFNLSTLDLVTAEILIKVDNKYTAVTVS